MKRRHSNYSFSNAKAGVRCGNWNVESTLVGHRQDPLLHSADAGEDARLLSLNRDPQGMTFRTRLRRLPSSNWTSSPRLEVVRRPGNSSNVNISSLPRFEPRRLKCPCSLVVSCRYSVADCVSPATK
jgi:hypothetical protein